VIQFAAVSFPRQSKESRAMYSCVRSIAIPLLFLLLAIGASSKGNAPAAQQAAAPSHQSAAIACRVMERHADKEAGTVIILFHQRDKPDQPRFKDFLLLHDGGAIEIQIGSGEWQKVTVWRMRNCFGRGLFIVSENDAPKEKAVFKIRAGS
jgi:hypothetical protein